MKRRPAAGSERGAAAVELAVVVLLLVLIVFGAAEAGRAFSQQNAVRGLAREGARIAAASMNADLDPLCTNANDLPPGATMSASAQADAAYGVTGAFEVTSNYESITPIVAFIPGFDDITLSADLEFVVHTKPDDDPLPAWNGWSC